MVTEVAEGHVLVWTTLLNPVSCAQVDNNFFDLTHP